MKDWLQEREIDIIYNLGYIPTVPATRVAWKLDIPSVTLLGHFCGRKWFQLANPFLALFNILSEIIIIRLAKHRVLVAQCQETADKVTAYTGADVEVICNTLLDPAAVSQAEKGADSKKIRGHLDIGDDELFLLHVGALIKVKNVYNLVKASSDWKRKFRLALVGDGPERVRIEALVQRLNLENDILLLGEKSHDDTLAIIKSCDVLLLSSICEQMPNVVLEALALGRPVIATKVGGVPEIKSANLHLVNKVEEMTQATGNGIEAAEEDKIMKEYSLERVAGQYERLFLSLTGSKMR